MKPVHQTRFGEGKGNCLQACIASIFEIDIDSIPFFQADPDNQWFESYTDWMIDNLGVQPVRVMWNGKPDGWVMPRGYHIMAGKGPRGAYHAVVGKECEMVFDPHPSNAGLEKIEEIDLFVRVIL